MKENMWVLDRGYYGWGFFISQPLHKIVQRCVDSYVHY